MAKSNIKLMFWYKRFGRFIYGAMFTVALMITFVNMVQRRTNIFIPVFLDVLLGLLGVVLESTLVWYTGQGTAYVETNKRADRFTLEEIHANNESYYVSEAKDEFSVKLSEMAYLKSYKKDGVVIEENPNIDMPVIEIMIIEKTSEPAENEYSIFAEIGDRIITENQKIIVKNRVRDISKTRN